MQAAAAVAAAYPPRGLIKLLPPEHTRLAPAPIERLIAEEYMLDTISGFDGDRVECARRLALGVFHPASLLPCLVTVAGSHGLVCDPQK